MLNAVIMSFNFIFHTKLQGDGYCWKQGSCYSNGGYTARKILDNNIKVIEITGELFSDTI